MAQVKLFCEKFADSELKTRSEVVFVVSDESGRDTYLVFNLNTESRQVNFKNQLICDTLYTWAINNYEPSWFEIDLMIAKIKKSGVLFY